MSEDSIRVEYNQNLKPLEKLLSGVKRSGDFFVNGVEEIPMPKLEVDGVGVLSFPVPQSQITALIQFASRAPYGRGEKTILDESIRKVWQLQPDKVRLSGKSWASNFNGILQKVIAGLSCEGRSVSAELYKLLIYDTGGFFLSHRDTEKAGGMFGTLVVVLPSAHQGGELILRHAGRETVIDLSHLEVSELGFAAFYADCEHEVRPITQGNRVCLIYNLIQQPSAISDPLKIPEYGNEICAAAALLNTHLSQPGAPAKIAWLLEHQYSPDGLSFSGLKSDDAARAKVLAQAATRAGCTAHLGIVHIEESGAAEESYTSYNNRYRYNEDDEDTSDDDFKIIDICDWRHYVSQWRNLQDEPVDFGEIPLAPGELLPAGALDNEPPDEQRLMGSSGNEGASFERSYHRAAVVIWQEARYAEVLLQAGVGAVLPYLKERLNSRLENQRSTTQIQPFELASLLVSAWKERSEYSTYRNPDKPGQRAEMLRLLNQLGELTLLEEFIGLIVIPDYDGSENEALLAATKLLGPEKTGGLFSELLLKQMRRHHAQLVDLLHSIGSQELTPDWRNSFHKIAETAVNQLDEVGSCVPQETRWIDWQMNKKASAMEPDLVRKLLDTLSEEPGLCTCAVNKFATYPIVFDPVKILVPALRTLQNWNVSAEKLWGHCAEFILQRSEHPPEPPKNWRQEIKLSCGCVDCLELQAFTLDPTEKIHRFRVRKDRRQHLHQQIEKDNLDMMHVTDRAGSPQTLVCTKDRRTYKRLCDQYNKDIEALDQLAKLAEKSANKNLVALKRIAMVLLNPTPV